MSVHIQSNCVVASGLVKARRTLCNEIVTFFAEKIEKEPSLHTGHKTAWRKGSFSWVYVAGVEHWTGYLFYELEKVAMATSKKKKSQTTSLDSYSFIRCELNSDDKKAAKVWIEENFADMGAIVHDAVASGYKMSISFSSDHDTFTASLTGKEGAVNEFKTITARHKDWQVAAMTVMYKHNVMFKASVWESDAGEDDGWS